MRRRYSLLTYIIFGLMGIGILTNFKQLLIPILVLGTIFLLYKFPPAMWRSWFRSKRNPKSSSYRKSSTTRFRVIDGQKKKDEPPKYH
jgi:hypothetical protein